MSRDALITAIDVGSSKVCALIAEVEREGRTRVVGVGVVPSRGMRRGVVVNVEQAVEAIAAAIAKAERTCGAKITAARVTVGGNHISALSNRGVVGVSHPDRTIRQADVQLALEQARVVSLPGDRQIIHILPRAFLVDGQEGVHNPAGMVGYRLEVDTHIVTGGTTVIQNLTQCLRRAGVEVESLVFAPLADAAAVLSEEEKEMGVALVDIGGGTTNLAVFTEGSVSYTGVLGLGGGHVSNDIAVGLCTPLGSAEELKLAHGHALAGAVDERETVHVPTFGAESEEVSRRRLVEIMEARLEEICGLVAAELGRTGYSGVLPAGVVLTGGTAETPGIEDLAREVFGLPVRVGRPRGVAGLDDITRGPAYAAAVGLLLWGARTGAGAGAVDGTRAGQRGGRLGEQPAQAAGVFGRLVGWLRSFLP